MILFQREKEEGPTLRRWITNRLLYQLSYVGPLNCRKYIKGKHGHRALYHPMVLLACAIF